LPLVLRQVARKKIAGIMNISLQFLRLRQMLRYFMNDIKKYKSRIILTLIIACFSLSPLSAQNYPGAAYFSYQCNADSISFLYQGNSVINASFSRVSAQLLIATTSQRNRLIAATSEFGLWALSSNELQIHFHRDSEGTKWVVPASVCNFQAGSTTTNNLVYSQATALAQSAADGQAVAVAIVMPDGTVIAYVQTVGTAVAYASAQSISGNVYIVQQGDTLYSIAHRYNTTVDTLVALNGLSDANVIYAGQVLQLP
jgi:LysM repeat protein